MFIDMLGDSLIYKTTKNEQSNHSWMVNKTRLNKILNKEINYGMDKNRIISKRRYSRVRHS